MKTKLLVLALLVGGSAFGATRFGFGFGFGPAYGYPAYGYPAYGYYVAPPLPPPAPVVAYAPPAPGPGVSWIGGYWYPYGGRWSWRAGYWARPPYAGAYWVAPRYFGGRFYAGHWRR